MNDVIRTAEAARRLGVSAHYLRMLEWEDRVPAVRYDRSGRVFTESDIALLRRMGVGSRPRRLKSPEEVLGVAR